MYKRSSESVDTNYRRIRWRGLPASAALVVATALHAGIQDIDEIIVTEELEQSIPLDLGRYGSQVDVIMSERIEALGFVDVAQALQMLAPGLHLVPKNGPFDYVNASLQGSRREEILWLVDGVRITNRLYAGTSPLDTIPAHAIEHIEILKGGHGIFYGSQSVGGVVNIITKGFSNTAGGGLGVGANSNDGFNWNGYLRGGSEQHQYVAFASHDKARGYRPYRDEDLQPSSTDRKRGYEVNSLGLKYAWSPHTNSRLSLQGIYTVADLDFARPFRNNHTVNAREETILTAKLNHRFSDAVELYVKVYQHTWDTEYTRHYNELDAEGNLTGGVVIMNDASYWGYDDYGFNAMAKLNFGGPFEYSVGVDQQNFSGEDDVWRISDQKEKVTAPFVQLRTTDELFESTLFALGIRNNRASNMENLTVWNLTGKHYFTENLYLQGSLGTSFRLPDAESLFLDEYYDDDNDGIPDGGWFAIGNPNLVPEESKNLNLTIGGNYATMSIELTYFKREIINYIDSYVPLVIGGVAGETFVNSNDEVNVRGLDLLMHYEFSDTLSTQLNYINTDARFNDEGAQLTHIPEREIKLGLFYEPLEMPIGLSLAANYVGDINDRVVRASYLVLDVSGSYEFGGDRQHRLVLRLENALDEEYATSTGVGTVDATGDPYIYDNLGVGRALHLNYRFRF